MRLEHLLANQLTLADHSTVIFTSVLVVLALNGIWLVIARPVSKVRSPRPSCVRKASQTVSHWTRRRPRPVLDRPRAPPRSHRLNLGMAASSSRPQFSLLLARPLLLNGLELGYHPQTTASNLGNATFEEESPFRLAFYSP